MSKITPVPGSANTVPKTREPTFADQAFAQLLSERGVTGLDVEPCDPSLPVACAWGATLRITSGDEDVRSVALFATEHTDAREFVRWFYQFHSDTTLTPSAVL